MVSEARISTPKYLLGRTCAVCGHCITDNIYNPMRMGLCDETDSAVKINRETTCNAWVRRQTI